jgi:hypothetical protein
MSYEGQFSDLWQMDEVVSWEGIWKEISPTEGELTTLFFKPTVTFPGTWNNNETKFEVIHKGGTQGSRPADLFNVG